MLIFTSQRRRFDWRMALANGTKFGGSALSRTLLEPVSHLGRGGGQVFSLTVTLEEFYLKIRRLSLAVVRRCCVEHQQHQPQQKTHCVFNRDISLSLDTISMPCLFYSRHSTMHARTRSLLD